ncbi:MAG: cell division protein ZapE [Alphaproteobacteria bacterium]|jgi:cell division protein ZapE|nr:cell division protein ZapE [Alphaproteobacteria bacterium]
MSTTPASPLELYERALSSGELRPQPAQRRAVEALDVLYQELILSPSALRRKRARAAVAKRGEGSGVMGWFGRLFGRRGKDAAEGADKDVRRSLYLFGPVGRGKTTAMDLFYDAMGPQLAQRRHFHEFMSDLHADIHTRRSKGDTRGDTAARFARAQARKAKVLCFDEFFVNNIADATLLGRVLSVMMEEGVTVVTTSNEAPGDLYTGGLKRELFLPTIELIEREFDIVNLDHAQDYRLRHGSEMEAWVSPLSAKTTQAFQTLFEREAKVSRGEPAQLSVLGRSVNVPEAAGRTARFRYADLCEQPLGRDDYLLIAQSFDRVFVDDIPMIRYSTRDSGERFRIMIDVFYEAGTSIYARAAAPIAELVNLEEHDMQPFLRTQSRLMEMQRLSYREAKAPIAA